MPRLKNRKVERLACLVQQRETPLKALVEMLSRLVPRFVLYMAIALLVAANFAAPLTFAKTSSPATGATEPLAVDGSDGFESGTLRGWSTHGVRAQKKYVADGAIAARATAKNSFAFMRRELTDSQTALTVQVSVLIRSQDSNNLPLLQLRTADDVTTALLFSDKNGRLGLQINDGKSTISSTVVGNKKWHVVSLTLNLGAKGSAAVQLDGKSVDKLKRAGGIDSDAISSIQLGSGGGATSFDVVFDSVKVSKVGSKATPTVRDAKPVTTPPAAISRLNDPVLQWRPEIVAASRATGVPPSLIAGIMAIESSGNRWEVSVAGAIGLMQVMPDELLAHGVSVDVGFDPATNVLVGAWILAERSGAGWELAAGYYFGIGCDAYGTCTGAYVRAALAWAAAYAPALGDTFYGNPAVVPASWDDLTFAAPDAQPASAASETTPIRVSTGAAKTPTPKSTPTSKATKEPTKSPTQAPTPVPTEPPTEVPTTAPTPIPTEVPTEIPTDPPTQVPTDVPTDPPPTAPSDPGTATGG